MYLEARLSTS
ncbi:hypothetical protein AYI70_g8948, partial [Smittium culicis]